MKNPIPFSPAGFESKWQKIWEEKGVYQPDLLKAKKPFYNLMMFPYPSAEGLHVGNMYAFTGADIYGRFQRMKGNDVFEPIGLDGFGIHSENYAIKVGKHPAEQAKISEANFYRQLRASGNGFAFRNTLETYDPDYYRWTQWIFVAMFKHGLAYRKKSLINFCPSCKTVLSDEQVINGACERCKTTVEKKEMEQWFFKITAYAEKLLQNTFKESFAWSEKVKVGQRNWIGRKEGINITYPVVDEKSNPLYPKPYTLNPIVCFTTRPDTNFGATFVVVAPEHPFISFLLSSTKLPKPLKQPIEDYVRSAKTKLEIDRIAEGREKTGVFTGFYAVNQLTGYKMPIYVTDFVLGHVGTGAVVGVPAHDQRDFEFAKKFNLKIKVVVIPGKPNILEGKRVVSKTPGRWPKDSSRGFIPRDSFQVEELERAYEGDGIMVNSGFLNGLSTKDAIRQISDHLEEKGWGKRITTYKLRDWCISRQRYWGAPIPMIYCEKCKWVPVPEDQLPVLLPGLDDWKPEGTGKGPLAKLPKFYETICPECGSAARRETDVCDTFLDSSWYFLRYPSVNMEAKKMGDASEGLPNGASLALSPTKWSDFEAKFGTRERQDPRLPWDREITRKWLPVHIYIGGAEHTVLHLLYARFVTMAFKDWGYIDFDEPFSKFYAHGLIIAEGAKMSKSRGNIIIPDEYIKKYGADALRTYLMFLGPFDMGGDFRDTGIAGMYRFLFRVWRLVIGFLETKKKEKAGDASEGLPNGASLALSPTKWSDFEAKFGTRERQDPCRLMHHTIREVTEDLENLRYNTAIAHIMEFVNYLADYLQPETYNLQPAKEAVKVLLLLLAPFAPHMTEELWQRCKMYDRRSQIEDDNKNHKSSIIDHKSYQSIHLHPWPSFDPKYLEEDEIEIIVQVNGKLRDTVRIQNLESRIQNRVEDKAKKSEKAAKYLVGKSIRKVIFVPGRLINFVV